MTHVLTVGPSSTRTNVVIVFKNSVVGHALSRTIIVEKEPLIIGYRVFGMEVNHPVFSL